MPGGIRCSRTPGERRLQRREARRYFDRNERERRRRGPQARRATAQRRGRPPLLGRDLGEEGARELAELDAGTNARLRSTRPPSAPATSRPDDPQGARGPRRRPHGEARRRRRPDRDQGEADLEARRDACQGRVRDLDLQLTLGEIDASKAARQRSELLRVIPSGDLNRAHAPRHAAHAEGGSASRLQANNTCRQAAHLRRCRLTAMTPEQQRTEIPKEYKRVKALVEAA